MIQMLFVAVKIIESNMKSLGALCFLITITTVLNASPDIIPIKDGFAGHARTTHYWDCCKPSCAWNYETFQIKAVDSCAIDGVTLVDDQQQSGCEETGGNAYTCNAQQPFIVNSTLAYGFTAASFSGGVDNSGCCRCILMSFTGQLQGKKLLAQITNTGGELYENHFDIQVPGGGVGYFNLGCQRQWDAPEDGWGIRYGGVQSEEECAELPEPLRDSCKFRWSFLEGVENPDVDFVQVECPEELSILTNCIPDDTI
ncbi:endoglucanase-like [Rhynchophorus ferrugineus]|uniref:endoglucanase-like n=1 Tax=Rhynchophorus ferrugineus TaxID=354439 RepID=UPI003FCEA70B